MGLCSALLLAACGEEAARSQDPELRALLALPAHLEVPFVPDYNPLTAEKIRLGRRLFYDRRLSGNLTQSCADCHFQRLAFADDQRTPKGSTGESLARNSPGLANVAYYSTLTWANNGLLELEDQILVPLTADRPTELGIHDGVRAEVLQRFDDDPSYSAAFAEAFPESSSGATLNKVSFALASFCRSLISGNSPYDRYSQGDKSALSEAQRRGLALFNGEAFECFHCHSGVNLTVSYRDYDSTLGDLKYPFFNNGLYNLGGDGSYPPHDQGLYDLTLRPGDRGLFRPPSLRNVALTAPYMHDGRLATLKDVLRHYARGGTLTSTGAGAGDGRLSPLKSGLVRGFQATEQELDDVVAFLESLTDPDFINAPAFSEPAPLP